MCFPRHHLGNCHGDALHPFATQVLPHPECTVMLAECSIFLFCVVALRQGDSFYISLLFSPSHVG